MTLDTTENFYSTLVLPWVHPWIWFFPIHYVIHLIRNCGILTSMLSFPLNMEETFSISFSRSDREDTSQTEPMILSFDFSHSCRHLLSSSSLREHVYTVAPNLANSSTMAYLQCTRLLQWLKTKLDHCTETIWAACEVWHLHNLPLLLLWCQFVNCKAIISLNYRLHCSLN